MRRKRILLRICLSVLSFFLLGNLTAQIQYEQMKCKMNEKSLPIINIEIDISKVSLNDYVQAEIEIADFYRRTDPTSLTVRYHCNVKYRGANSSQYQKKSFAVKLIDNAGDKLNVNLFGIRHENNWILDAMAMDRIRMRNRFCFDTWNDMSKTPYTTPFGNRNGTSGMFVELFVNGEYHGLYCMSDKIDRKLLGLEKAKESEDGVVVKGLLYKGVSWEAGATLRSYIDAPVDQPKWNAWELKYPDDYPSIDTWRPLMNLIDFCSDATKNDVFREEYKEWFYPENLADYLVMCLAFNVGDNVYKNTYLSVVDINEHHRYLITPWDMDMSLGGNWDGAWLNQLASLNKYNSTGAFNRLVGRNVDNFKEKVADVWFFHSTTLFSPQTVSQRLDSFAEMFAASGAWEREVEKWNNNPVPLKENLADELSYVKDWYSRNYTNLCSQLSRFSGINGVVMPERTKGVYSLDGRKVDAENIQSLPKGIYIVNGRKIVVTGKN